jgi:hypothetical protein
MNKCHTDFTPFNKFVCCVFNARYQCVKHMNYEWTNVTRLSFLSRQMSSLWCMCKIDEQMGKTDPRCWYMQDCNFWKIVIRDTELNVFQTFTYNTIQLSCRSKIALTPWNIVSLPLSIATPTWCGLKCFANVSLNWIANLWATNW